MSEDLKSKALEAAWQWLVQRGQERISVEEYHQLCLADDDLPDIAEIYGLYGSWHEFERSAQAFAALNGSGLEARLASLGPRSRLSGLAKRATAAEPSQLG